MTRRSNPWGCWGNSEKMQQVPWWWCTIYSPPYTRHKSMERKRSEISMSEDDLNMWLRGVGIRWNPKLVAQHNLAPFQDLTQFTKQIVYLTIKQKLTMESVHTNSSNTHDQEEDSRSRPRNQFQVLVFLKFTSKLQHSAQDLRRRWLEDLRIDLQFAQLYICELSQLR